MVAEENDESEESLLCIQVVKKNKNLMTTVNAKAGDSRKQTVFQLDTGASCNILAIQIMPTWENLL